MSAEAPSWQVQHLEPGDVIHLPDAGAAIHVGQMPHPLRRGFVLVIQRHQDGTWFHDCLDPRMVISGYGHVVKPTTHTQRMDNVREALRP